MVRKVEVATGVVSLVAGSASASGGYRSTYYISEGIVTLDGDACAFLSLDHSS
jgi:hypothetical protein